MKQREVETVNISGLSDSEVADLIASLIFKIREGVASHANGTASDGAEGEEEEAQP